MYFRCHFEFCQPLVSQMYRFTCVVLCHSFLVTSNVTDVLFRVLWSGTKPVHTKNDN